MKKILWILTLSIFTLQAETSLPDASKAAYPKIVSAKKRVDKTLAKIEGYAQEGKAKKFPSICAKTDTRLLKYTYKDAPKEVYDYYNHAKNVCRGKLHALALQANLKQEGKDVCEKMEVTIQISHIKSFIKKIDDMPVWDGFVSDFKQVCPNNLNF